MRKWLFFLILLTGIGLHAQETVTIVINSLPVYTSENSDIFLAGSFNGWNPNDENYRFQRSGNGIYNINLRLKPGQYEYKITGGGWDKAECKADGSGISNRVLSVPSDTVRINIEGWADLFLSRPKISTAGKNVRIIDTAFLIPQLNRKRRVWVYLPGGYESTNRRYPVLYLMDGQNVFEDTASYAGEWGVDECIDTMKNKCIVVAIDHGGANRISEYCPYDMGSYGKGAGKPYTEFLVHTLKPFIDKHYRTLASKKSTYIAGSSMGGLISMYAVLSYPEVFGGAGVFSPAFWVGPSIFDDIKKQGRKIKSKIYFYVGSSEGEGMVPDTEKAFGLMKQYSVSKLNIVIRENGQHNEAQWRAEFPLFYKWMMKSN